MKRKSLQLFLSGIFLPAGVFFLFFLCEFGGIFQKNNTEQKKVLHVSIGKRITSLDPALASDSYSQKLVSAIFDTPLQYVYTKKTPVQLECGMLEKMPEISADGKKLLLTLRKDLYFHEKKCFPDKKSIFLLKIFSGDISVIPGKCA